MDVVILAAGQSKRLKKFTEDRPKCLVEVAGRSILERQLDAMNVLGINNVLIVAGFMAQRIHEFVKAVQSKYDFRIEVIDNELFASTDNAYSLSLGMDKATGPVIVLDGDVVFDSDLLKILYDSKWDNALLCDSSRTPDEEDCKVLSDDGFAKGIGKKVPGQSIYTSMIKMGGPFLSIFIEELNKDRKSKEWYSEPLDRVLRSSDARLSVLYTNGHYRTEIDNEEDLEKAEIEVQARGI